MDDYFSILKNIAFPDSSHAIKGWLGQNDKLIGLRTGGVELEVENL